MMTRNVFLPEDFIFTEILPRISCVKSLLRFKCVSKPWCFFISSDKFAKIQLKTSSQNSTSLGAVMIYLNDGFFSVRHCHVDDLFSQQDTTGVDQFAIDYAHSYYLTRVVGCCDGLYCMCLSQKHFMLVNPCTRKYHQLPALADKEVWVVGGYGFGEFNGDYKVFTQFQSHSPYVLISKLYSFKTNSWKTVEGPDLYSSHYEGVYDLNNKKQREGVFLNGKLHWPMRTHLDIKIVSFDLGSEMVGVVNQPSFTPGKCKAPESMSVIQGCLCLVHCNFDNVTDVWVMKEYGVKESWCKLITLPDFDKYEAPIPVCISQEGELFVKHGYGYGYGYLIYSPKTKSHRRLKVIKSRQICDIGIGIQSLVSPFPV